VDRSGQPKVTDFGLARLLQPADDAATGLTQGLEVMGSPPYMAPEQALGRMVGVGADVYSLGGVLYFLLTGRPPFQGASLSNLLAQVAHDTPVAPRRLDPSLPKDLETVAMKCLAKDPARRYASAAELAEELERYASGLPVRARPVGPAERLWRWARRKPALAGMLAMMILTISLGVIATAYQWRRAVIALEAQMLARRGLEENNYAADIQAASQAILGHNQLEIGRKLLDRHAASPLRHCQG
jgi:eukaryotic-like serine/threonine-protein kinase